MSKPITKTFVTSIGTFREKIRSASVPAAVGEIQAAEFQAAKQDADRALDRLARAAEAAFASIQTKATTSRRQAKPIEPEEIQRVATRMKSLVIQARSQADPKMLKQEAQSLTAAEPLPLLKEAIKIALNAESAPTTKAKITAALNTSISNAHIDSQSHRGGG